MMFWLFFAYICGRVNGQNESGTAENQINYPQYYDPQTHGFNSTKIKSDPLVIVDTKTIFIPNIRYSGENKTLNFWAGTGSPYTQSQLVAEKVFIANNSNIYVSFPEDIRTDKIDYFSIGENAISTLDYVIFASVDRSQIRDGDNLKENQSNIYRISKCCNHDQAYQPNGSCGKTNKPIVLDIPIFPSNSSGLDPERRLNKSEYEIRPFINPLMCEKDKDVRIFPFNEYGLIYNSSLIVKEDAIRHLGQFCIDQYENETIVLICYEIRSEAASISPNIYLPALVVSMICFATSASVYCFILKVKYIHKRCFIIFTVSMTITFLSLILIQVQNNEGMCNVFGFLFIFFTVCSFLWLAILCFDLLYKIKFFRENEQKSQRFYWYITVALSISLAVLLISLFSGEIFVPDVPSSFVKGYGGDKCEFSTSTSRIFIFFSPMVASFLTCIASLSLIPCYFRKNEKHHKNEFDWVENKNSYKFLSTSYTILVAVSCFWLINVAFNFLTMNVMTQLALDVIEASLGMVTISIFIFNKYTMREIKEKMSGKKPKYVTEESLELNGYRTPITPRTPASDMSEPMFPNVNGDNPFPANSNRTFNTFHG